MKTQLRSLLLVVALVLMSVTARAVENLAVPGQVQFAGRIEGLNLTAEGAEATEVAAGVRGVTFSLFAEQSGGAALWVESQNVAVSGDGAYTTLLGAETQGGIPQSIFASGEARWLEVTYTGADGVQVTQPRVLLVSVPYAMKAGDAATLGGLPVSAFVLNADAVASRVSDNGGLPGATVTDVLPSAAVTAGRIAKFNSALATDVVDSIITESSGKIGIGTTTPVGTIDVGGWASIPGDIQGVGSTISGDVFMGNTNGGIGRFRMASNALQGFFSWNQYYNGTNHKGMDATAPGWRVNIGGTGGEDAYYVERSPATANGHVPARLFVVNGNGRVGINTGTAAPLATLDVGGWPAIPNDIQGVGTTISGDVFMGNTNGGIGRYRMASNALQGFFSWNQYYNGVGHKGMDATAPGWRINVGGTGIEDAFYVERSPATANLHAPARLFQVSGSGNVGIGTTAPTAKFHVVGNSLTTGTATVGGFTMNVGSSLAGKVLTSDASGVGTWQTASGGGAATDVICPAPCVASSEIVDGTIADADIAPAANIAPTKIAGTAAVLGANTFTGAQTINNTTVVNGSFTVDTATLRVDAVNDRVGIGTASPLQALDVNGNIRLRTGGSLIVDAGAAINCTNCINSSQLDDGTDLSDGGTITGDINVNGSIAINETGLSPAIRKYKAEAPPSAQVGGNLTIGGSIFGNTMFGTFVGDGSGLSNLPGSGLSGSGTTNRIAKFTGATALGDSQLFDNGTNVGLGTTTPTAKLDVVGAVKANSLALPDTSSNTVGVISFNGSPFLHTYGGNLFLGEVAGNFTNFATNNMGLGASALAGITFGFQNVAVGIRSLEATNTGAENVALGYETLKVNTSGINNTALGSSVLRANIVGGYNTGVGNGALFNNTGDGNTSVGAASMVSNNIGVSNSALGGNALYGNTTGSWNTAVGFNAGFPSISGNFNKNVTGSKNTYIGAEAGPGSSTQYTNSTAIGANAVVTASNVVVLGSINAVNGAVSGVNVGVGKSAPDQKLHVDGGLRLDTATAKPTCSASTRGTFWVTQGATNVKDSVEVCAKDAANAYAWRTLY